MATTGYLMCLKMQYRFPKSKSKRIRKKWSKNGRNFKFIFSERGVDDFNFFETRGKHRNSSRSDA
jgi:hypothetical protein